jgi:hypothetical protein
MDKYFHCDVCCAVMSLYNCALFLSAPVKLNPYLKLYLKTTTSNPLQEILLSQAYALPVLLFPVI